MENVGKLVETINAAIQKAGGEAARVWPDMVASYAMSAWISAGGFGAAALVFLGISGYALWAGFRYRPTERWDDGRGFFFGVALVALVIGAGAAGLCAGQIPHALYPEANLVKSLVR